MYDDYYYNKSKQQLDKLGEIEAEHTNFENVQKVVLLEKEKAVISAVSVRNKIAALSGMLIALLTLFFLYRNKQKNKIIIDQNNRLESLNATKDQIFSIIGHDLKKPALAFRGITNKLNYLIDNNDKDRLIRFGESIETDAIELNKLTDNLLNWALLQKDLVSVNSEEIALQELVTENIALFQRIADEKKITFTSDLAISTVKSDKHILSTVIRNLMDNAIKYTPEGGAITIKAQELDDRISLSVQDSGVGMSEAQVNKLFTLDKAKSTKGTMGEGGTGLGLSLIHI